MAESTVATPEVQQSSTTEHTRHQERYLAPPVDIYETPEGLVVLADLPGVAKDALDVRVDHNVLTIRGHACHGVPGEAVYREYALVNFFRQFALSEKVDQTSDHRGTEEWCAHRDVAQGGGSQTAADRGPSRLTARHEPGRACPGPCPGPRLSSPGDAWR